MQRFPADNDQIYSAMFRNYRPGLGRWLKRDPLGDVDGTNVYRYVGNRPTEGVDPTGLFTDITLSLRFSNFVNTDISYPTEGFLSRASGFASHETYQTYFANTVFDFGNKGRVRFRIESIKPYLFPKDVSEMREKYPRPGSLGGHADWSSDVINIFAVGGYPRETWPGLASADPTGLTITQASGRRRPLIVVGAIGLFNDRALVAHELGHYLLNSSNGNADHKDACTGLPHTKPNIMTSGATGELFNRFHGEQQDKILQNAQLFSAGSP